MCGICGTVGLADERLIEAMSESIAHRGPDGQGTRCFPSDNGRVPAALGHRRLSIIDPTPRGAQPMSYADGRYWITYNGELYNFKELRRELVSDGYSFDSDCDTEVVLAMYARYGAEMVRRLNGIFAFGIWDTHHQELFVARDRLGVKPLYYSQRGETLYFGSEVKALLEALPPVGLRPELISDYLTFLWVPDPDTLFEGIYKLPPGHYATFARGRLAIRQYWDMTFAPEDASAETWAERVRDSVGDAVRRQMVSDVPLGSFLSGGIDSSAIVNELSQAREDKLTTYTVGFSQKDLGAEIVPDDVRYSRVMAQELDLDYHEHTLDADVVDLLPKLVWHMDEPIADSAPITTYLICAAARERLTVIMSGMGGDEIFAGYPRHLAAQIGRLADLAPAGARRALRQTLEGRLTMGRPGRLRGPRRNAMKLVRGIDGSPEERYLTYCSYYRPDELARLLSPELRAATGDHDPFRRHREYFDKVRDEHWLNRLLYVDAKTFLPCLNLAYTDKMSMAASTEVRVPFLDNEMVDLAARIPPELKLRRCTRKYVFKRSQEGRLPKDVIWRPKAGFGAPVRSWLVGELKPMVEDLLSPSAVADRGLFDPAEVQRLIRANEAGTEDNALRIWELVTLELWQRAFLDSQPQRRQASPRPVVL
jgi:asparagine synthase (glutamine-hydrolysing)